MELRATRCHDGRFAVREGRQPRRRVGDLLVEDLAGDSASANALLNLRTVAGTTRVSDVHGELSAIALITVCALDPIHNASVCGLQVHMS
ncbi:hypothetical protein, partial [Streptomyces leeuwenhoekii]|uniref:hypothetical protein n=1 Tax=Streptomyces leeuwenhoekii TaxID=1437453 RepID=UPI0021661EE4